MRDNEKDQYGEVSMWKRVGQLFGGTVVALGVASVVFLLAMRSKCPPVLNAVRRFNRSFTNPRAMETAGQPGAYASVIRHVGRASGTAYETPIGPYPTDEGFVIPLPYGTTPDWLKNVQRAGSATIISEGTYYQVGEPQIIDAQQAMSSIPHESQRSLRWFNIDEFLTVRRVGLDS
jgi:deazaflavin-dependent oxidoreductase (nitroreductase family)